MNSSIWKKFQKDHQQFWDQNQIYFYYKLVNGLIFSSDTPKHEEIHISFSIFYILEIIFWCFLALISLIINSTKIIWKKRSNYQKNLKLLNNYGNIYFLLTQIHLRTILVTYQSSKLVV